MGWLQNKLTKHLLGKHQQQQHPNNHLSWAIVFFLAHTTRQAQAHLWRVYAVLAAGFAFAALGCFSSYTIHPFVINLGWIVSAIGLCVFYQNMYAASCFYLGFSSCTGGLVSAFFRYTAIPDDDKIVVQMLMQVAILFVVFSILAATTNRLAWLWLGGWGFSILANLLVAALAQAVFAISMSMSILLFIKNFLFGFYILYDTQRILESFYAGEENILVHVKMPFDDAFRLVWGFAKSLSTIFRPILQTRFGRIIINA